VGRIEMGRQNSGNLGGDLSEKGQSSLDLDNQGCDSQPSMDKSEGQLLEDAKVVGSMLTSAFRSLKGITTLTSPNDDDPLVYLKAVDQIRHERSLRPSHVVEGGGAELNFGFQASNFWRCQSKASQVELPTEIRKSVLKERVKISEQQLLPDPEFHGSAWCIRHSFGPQREKTLRKFWREVYEEENHDPQRVFKEFALNDYLEASDELHGLENPMRSWWRPSWKHRSSAAAVRSGMSIVGTESVSLTGLT
jgi:hypothetical protein